jgi:hypothetical protein
MLMTGSEDRGVAAIERLTKQQFETRVLGMERAPRRERGEGEARSERRDRPPRRDVPVRPAERHVAAPAKPVDEFFSKPYESGVAGAAPVEPPKDVAIDRQKPARVAALLGGSKR